MRSTQITAIRRLFILALLVTLSFIPINDTTRAESKQHHISSYADGRVNASIVNVRSGPGLGYSIVGYGVWSESIYVSRQALNCSWLEVSMDDGTKGWVYAPLVELYRACSGFAVAPIHVAPTATPKPSSGHGPGHGQGVGQVYVGPNGSHHYDPGVTNQTAGGYAYAPQPQTHKPHQPYYGTGGHYYDPHPKTHGVVHVPQAAPASTGNRYVTLVSPIASDLRGLQDFVWQPTAPLGPGEAYELVFWRPGEDPMVSGFSPYEATTATSVLVDLDESIRRIGQLQSGFDYMWGVLLVRTAPYQRIASLTTGQRFHLEFLFQSGGGSNGGGPNPTATSAPNRVDPTPTPTPGNGSEPPTPVPPPFVLGTFTPTPIPTNTPIFPTFTPNP